MILPLPAGYDIPITSFASRLIATERVHAPFDDVWAVFASTDRLAALTPLVAEIHDRGEVWQWRMAGITALGITAAPAFTTLMDINEHGMRFRPDPSRPEVAAAAGEIRVTPVAAEVTDLLLDLTTRVDLPLPAAMRGPVTRVMYSTLKAGGQRFAASFLASIGSPPHDGLRVRRAPVVRGEGVR